VVLLPPLLLLLAAAGLLKLNPILFTAASIASVACIASSAMPVEGFVVAGADCGRGTSTVLVSGTSSNRTMLSPAASAAGAAGAGELLLLLLLLGVG
jgi:hypothetical protein